MHALGNVLKHGILKLLNCDVLMFITKTSHAFL